LATLEAASAIDASNPRIHYNKALLLAEMGRTTEAITAFGNAERLGAENDRVYINHSAFLQQQQMDAKPVLDAGLRRFPDSIDLLAEVVGLLIRTGKVKDADTYLARWRSLAPQDPRLLEMQRYRARVGG
jgi:Flp pilus assembly protein TadD